MPTIRRTDSRVTRHVTPGRDLASKCVVHVSELWRYPVKSMGGERLDACDLTAAGIPGDRVLRVERHGRTVTSRSRPGLLLHHARLSAAGEPLVDERAWTHPAVARDVIDAAGEDARLVHTVGLE